LKERHLRSATAQAFFAPRKGLAATAQAFFAPCKGLAKAAQAFFAPHMDLAKTEQACSFGRKACAATAEAGLANRHGATWDALLKPIPHPMSTYAGHTGVWQGDATKFAQRCVSVRGRLLEEGREVFGELREDFLVVAAEAAVLGHAVVQNFVSAQERMDGFLVKEKGIVALGEGVLEQEKGEELGLALLATLGVGMGEALFDQKEVAEADRETVLHQRAGGFTEQVGAVKESLAEGDDVGMGFLDDLLEFVASPFFGQHGDDRGRTLLHGDRRRVKRQRTVGGHALEVPNEGAGRVGGTVVVVLGEVFEREGIFAEDFGILLDFGKGGLDLVAFARGSSVKAGEQVFSVAIQQKVTGGGRAGGNPGSDQGSGRDAAQRQTTGQQTETEQ